MKSDSTVICASMAAFAALVASSAGDGVFDDIMETPVNE
jgi:hypothetical protein